MKKIIGCDIDGVLADFVCAYTAKIILVTGRELISPDTEWADWNMDSLAGYTTTEINATWELIKEDRHFWLSLPPYGCHETDDALEYLSNQRKLGADVYFITSRVGDTAKWQSEIWLEMQGFRNPTVLISRDDRKCSLAKGLRLTHFIDDKVENFVQVESVCPNTYLLDRPWNRQLNTPHRVSTIVGFADNP